MLTDNQIILRLTLSVLLSGLIGIGGATVIIPAMVPLPLLLREAMVGITINGQMDKRLLL